MIANQDSDLGRWEIKPDEC